MFRMTWIPMMALLLFGCTHPFIANTNLIRNDFVPTRKAPYVASFQKGNHELRYLATPFRAKGDITTFKWIEQQMTTFQPEALIFWLPYSPDAPKSVKEELYNHIAQTCPPSFSSCRQDDYILLKASPTTQLVSAMATDADKIKRFVGLGYQPKEWIYHSVCMIPSHSAKSMPKEAFSVEAESLISSMKENAHIQDQNIHVADFLQWFQEKMGKPFVISEVRDADTMPNLTGTYLERLSYHTGLILNMYMVDTIAAQLTEHKKVMVVFNVEMLENQLPALEDMMGKATYSD